MDYMHNAVRFKEMMNAFNYNSIANYFSHEINLDLSNTATVFIIIKKRFEEGSACYSRTMYIDIEFFPDQKVKMVFYGDCKIPQSNFELISCCGGGVSRREMLYQLEKMIKVAERPGGINLHAQIKPAIVHFLTLFTQSHIFPNLLEEEPVPSGPRHFTLGDEWGPAKCEMNDCGAETDTIVLSEDENRLLPVKSGPEAVSYILDNKLGRAMCSTCRNIN